MTHPPSIQIGAHRVGPESPCLVIAEAGVNHNGKTALAHALIDVAAECGADAVKFQTFRPERLVSSLAGAAPYQRRDDATTQRRMLEALVLPTAAWSELASHAAERSILFLSTAFDVRSLDLLVELGIQAVKVPSGELDNLEFIAALASRRLPMILSTGLGTLDEVGAAVEAASTAPGIALLHCVTAYPAPIASSNLRAMATMAEAFRAPVGWSDHTEGSLTATVAVALGAAILEKHFTTDRSLPGPDHRASADPGQLAEYVEAVRAAEACLGDGVKRPTEAELENLRFVRRSYHATRDLAPGDVLRAEDVVLLRPAAGLPPSAKIRGRTVARAVAAGQPLCPEDLR